MTGFRTAMLALALSATASAPLAAAEGGEGGLFSMNGGLMVWTVVIFLLLLVVLRRYAWGPILGALEARENGIQNAIDQARQEREAAAALLAEHRDQLADARRQAQQIIAESRQAGDQLRRSLEEKAREESQAILANARREIEREKDAALDQLRQESVEIALAAASRLIRERLDDARDRQLVEGYLQTLTDRASGAEA